MFLLDEVYALTLENMEQCVRGLEDLHVRCLGFINGGVILSPRLHTLCQAFVNAAQAIGQNANILLNLSLFFLVLENLTVYFLALIPKILNAYNYESKFNRNSVRYIFQWLTS